MHLVPTTYPAAQPMLSLWREISEKPAPSAAVVAAVLSFGDVRELGENGVEVIRFSHDRVFQEDIQLLLGPECRRALDISIVWDDREMELIDVMDRPAFEDQSGEDLCGDAYARAKMRDFPSCPGL